MNRFVIEQTKEKTQLATSLHQSAELEGIRLARAKASGDRPQVAFNGQIAVSINVRAKRVETVAGQLSIEVLFRLMGSRKSENAKERPAFCIDCTFEANYILRPGFEPSEEQVSAFKDGNAIFNCWPYCRQHIQETLLTMGYPPLTLPFLRVVTKQQATRKRSKST